MANVPIDKQSQPTSNDLTKEFHAQQYSTEENVPFNNPSLYKKLASLRNNADFAPLIAHDMVYNKDFAPSSSSNTWQIVFNDQWQQHDRYNTFSEWCDELHTSPEYHDLLDRLDTRLFDWQDTLGLPSRHTKTEWFRPPTFPSTLKMSLERELTSDWSTFYKDNLAHVDQTRYSIHFNINTLYSTLHCNLIDAIYFAKCVNWDAAYDPKHSAKTNIPMYWIFAEITFDFPSANHAPMNGASTYSPNTFSVPISCYGLMHVEVNAIKDWYKLSPHCPECRDVRGRLQIHDDVEVFVGNKWQNGTIIDCVIMDHNEVNTTQRNEPIVEYLQVQTTNDALIRYNRYDERLRPCLNTQRIRYDSTLLFTRTDEESKHETDENEALLTPPSDINIEQNAPPGYDIGHKVNKSGDTRMDHERQMKPEPIWDEYKVEPQVEVEPMNEDLLSSFDFRNAEIMKQYQNDLRETMETMQKLALRRTVATDIFRPVHLVCPKLTYRVLLSDENEVNMTVLSRNDAYDYIALKMIDTQDVELSEMTVYMTKQQLFEHCTTYFHFADMKDNPNEVDFEYTYHNTAHEEKEETRPIVHNIPPTIAVEQQQSLDTIHQYMRQKDSSISPKRRNVNVVREATEESKDDPRSHLQDSLLRTFLHDDEAQDHGSAPWTLDTFVKPNSMNSTDSMEFKQDMMADHTAFAMSAQQQFIESNWNTKPDRMGLGTSLMDKSDESISGGASIGHQSLDHNDEPATPKMISGSPSFSEEIVASDIHHATGDEENTIFEMTTKGMDCTESEEENNEDANVNEADEIVNNRKARASVKRVGVVSNDGKYEENEDGNVEFNFADSFNEIGINQYDARDDEINAINDLDEALDDVLDVTDVNRVPIERVYTVNRCVVCFVILLSIVLLPILSPYLPEKYRYFEFDFDRAPLQWKRYWDNVIRTIEQILLHFGLI